MVERIEVPCPIRIVFEKESIDRTVRKEGLGNGPISAGRKPGGTEIAAADMHGNDHILGFNGKDLVEDLDIFFGNMVQVKTAFGIGFAFIFITEFAPGRIVQLEITAACVVEGQDRFLVGSGNVFKSTASSR